jgi:hypothetical protein
LRRVEGHLIRMEGVERLRFEDLKGMEMIEFQTLVDKGLLASNKLNLPKRIVLLSFIAKFR